jgi:transcriptional regulator with XRE-family HTH domain
LYKQIYFDKCHFQYDNKSGGDSVLKDNIKKFREALGISQRELGRRIKKTGQYISYLESAENSNPSLNVLGDIAIALGVKLNDLTENDENVKLLIQNQAALSASNLFPYDGDKNSWIIKNLNEEEKDKYIKESQDYMNSKDYANIRDKQLSILATFVETIAENFIEVSKDNIDDFSMSIASWLIDYVEMATKAKIKETIEKNIAYEKK